MIQRIQSVYLFFVFCLTATVVFFPFSSSWVASFGAGIVAALSLIVIFLYKHRVLQIKIGYLILLLLLLLYVPYIVFDHPCSLAAECLGHIRFTFMFPVIAGVLTLLAIRGIKKDEQLIRSLDRLR